MPSESSLTIGQQVLVPFLFAGLGMVMAGMVLDVVQVSVNFFVSLILKLFFILPFYSSQILLS